MNNQSRWTASVLAALAAVMLFAVPVVGSAQETTSAIRGKILDPNGAPVSSAIVSVEDLRNGSSRNYTSSVDGVFLASRLLPGGPYRVIVNGTKSIDVPSISVGETYGLTVNMVTEAAIDEIVTIGQAASMVEVASGPSATFNLSDLENAVSFSRDISDVYGIDPRLMVDNDEDGFGINCAGKHPKFNNVTLDGVSQTDRFGLNDNGYSTAVGMPFPYDAIEQIAVELAPFDVTYGGFSACNINAVTKSGSNDWEAKAFYEFSDNGLRGDRVAGTDRVITNPSYDKTYRGFNVGGPIIKDKLFFFAAFEDSESPRFIATGPAGSGNGTERAFVDQATADYIEQTAMSVYGYDTGGYTQNGVQADEKYMLRLDWLVNDDHSASIIYNKYDGFQDRDSDSGSTRWEFANHGYQKGAVSETITGKLTSRWTDRFSTEVFYSTNEMNDSQVTIGDIYFAEMQISVPGGTIYLGADDSRQANRLDTKSNFLKLSANYLVGDHIITAGLDSEELEIFNQFVQHARGGEFRFFDDSGDNAASCALLTAEERANRVDGCEPSGLDRFELGRPSRTYYGSGGGTNDAADAAANFKNRLNALYVQDEIFVDHLDLTLVAGLRYEWFSSDDRPVANSQFAASTGIPNDSNIDGLDLLMPRFGFTWGATDTLTMRGGVGLYSGGNPNVWISNAWSNDGITNAQISSRLLRYCDPGDPNNGVSCNSGTLLQGQADSIDLIGEARPGIDVPQAAYDWVADRTADDGATSNLVIIDPDYKQPSEWKFALGGTWDMHWADITMDFDYLHTRGKNSAYYVDLSQSVVGQTIIGTPIYDYTNGRDNYMLTNSSASPVSNVLSMTLNKEFDWGLNVLFGYAYTEAEDVAPMTSATAGSNFDNVALTDLVNIPAAGSNWVVPHRLTLRLDYERAFFGDNLTRFTVFGYANEGQPQSYGMGSGDLEGDGFFGRHLLYVPTGDNDPNVIFGPDFETAEFFAWVATEGLAPGVQERNSENAKWSTRWDLRISQEVPLPGDFIGRAYFKVYNFGNMLNDDWGAVNDAEFFTPVFVDAGVDDVTGQFIFTDFNQGTSINDLIETRSLWEARIGIDIKFGK
jgi:hypothetical protein